MKKLIEFDDERKVRVFYDKRISDEVPADSLGEEFKGYVFKITGGFDKQGFAMKQGVSTNGRVRLLLDGSTGHYNPKRFGERRRKSIRGCIVGPDLSVLNVMIVKKGAQDLAGLTDPDSDKPSTRGPKRASNIRRHFGLTKEDDLPSTLKLLMSKAQEGKKRVRTPQIQRLVTPGVLQHKRRRIALKKRRATANAEARAEYNKVVTQIRKERRQSALSKKRVSAEKKSASKA